jgi:hypothetical protein
VAVLLLVTCATPKTAGPSQWAAVESQKVTCPTVTGEVPVTVAVSVTAVPAVMLLDETVKAEVVVIDVAACADGSPANTNTRASKIRRRFRDMEVFMAAR